MDASHYNTARSWHTGNRAISTNASEMTKCQMGWQTNIKCAQ